MTLRKVIKQDTSGEEKEVILEIDPTLEGGGTSEQTYSVKGKVRNSKGEPQAGVTVRAFDKELTVEQLLGEAVTNATGDYAIYYSNTDIPNGKLRADLFVRAYDISTDPDTILKESVIKLTALPNETIDVYITFGPTKTIKGTPEYTLVKQKVEPLLGTQDLNNITLLSISIISNKVNLETSVITDFLKAKVLDQQYANATITEEVFYGLFRFNLPYKAQELIATDDNIKREALLSTTSSNIIDPDIENDIDAIIDAFNDLLPGSSLIEPVAVDGKSLIAQLLDIAGLDDTQKENFMGAYLADKDDPDFWTNIVSNGVLTATEVDNVKFVLQIGITTQNHIPMVSLVYNNSAYNQISDLGDITRSTWRSYVDQSGIGVPNILETEATEEDKNTYVTAILDAVDNGFASETLKRDLQLDADFSGSPILNFVQANDSFDIRSGSVRKFIAENPTALSNQSIDPEDAKKEILKTKRLYHLTEGEGKTDTIKSLEDNNITSANQIARIGSKSFVKDYATQLGGKAQAQKIYKRAVKRSAAAVFLQSSFSPAVNNLSSKVFKSNSIDDASTVPELEVLFGSQDYCNCKHCRSSLSPSAYFIDLLNFLKQTKVTDGNGDVVINPDNSQPLTGWDELKKRRPEFGSIELSCINTNTALPYIDLVNELLENEISTTTDVNRQTSLTTEELLANPEHLNKEAYDLMATAKYPLKLPFNLWNEESNAFLANKDINRAQLIKAFNGRTDENTQMSIEEACVYLGISTFMLDDVLKDTAFSPHFDNRTTASLNDLTDPTNKNGILDITGFSFNEFKHIIQSNFVNPNDKQIEFTPPESCDVNDASIDFSGNEEYTRLHKFIRLSKITGWSYELLDEVLVSLGISSITTNAAIIQIAEVKIISDKLGIKPEVAALMTADLTTVSYGESKSPYEKVFLKPVYYNNNNTVTAQNTLKYLFENAASTPIDLLDGNSLPKAEVFSVIQGATGLSSENILMLIEQYPALATSSISELSFFYRLANLLKVFDLTANQFLDFIEISEFSPIKTPTEAASLSDALRFIFIHELLEGLQMTVGQLTNFLKGGKLADRETEDLTNLIAEVQQDQRKVLEAKGINLDTDFNNVDLGTDSDDLSNLKNDLRGLLLLFLNENTVNESVILVDDSAGSFSNQASFIETNWEPILGESVANNLNSQLTSNTDVGQRLVLVIKAFYKEAKAVLQLNNVVVQTIANEISISQEMADSLLNAYLENPANTSEPVTSLFTDFEFVSNDTAVIEPGSFQNEFISLRKISKLSEIINSLSVTVNHLDLLFNKSVATGWFNIQNLPIDETDSIASGDFDKFILLLQVYVLENKYSIPNQFSLIQLLSDVEGTLINEQEFYERLSLSLGWSLSDINYLKDNVFTQSYPAGYLSGEWLWNVDSVISLTLKLNSSASQLDQWKLQDVNFDQSQAIRMTIKALYEDAEWYKVAEKIRNVLRKKQRDALVAFTISTNEGFKSPDDVYSYYLLDVETEPCSLTSRIKLAISSVQLWIQRIRMSLEANISFTQEDLAEWEWRKNYRVWEAARKVFLYPENWLEPELRDDKSPFYSELEEELLQDDINNENVERAYLNYLSKMDEIARLDIAASCMEEDRNIFHVYARTKNQPHKYFTRRMLDGYRWTAWEKLDVDIEGDHLVAVIFNRRPMLFWPSFNSVGDPSAQEIDSETPQQPKLQIEIKLNYCEYKNGKWSAKRLSKNASIIDIDSSEYRDLSNYYFKPKINESGLVIEFYKVGTTYTYSGGFKLDNCNGELIVKGNGEAALTSPPSNNNVTESSRHYMKIYENVGHEKLEIKEKESLTSYNQVDGFSIREEVRKTIFNSTPGRFKLSYPITELELLSEVPFFYEDDKRLFLIKPENKPFRKKEYIDIKPIWTPIVKPILKESPISESIDDNDKNIDPVISDPIASDNTGDTTNSDPRLEDISKDDNFLLNAQ